MHITTRQKKILWAFFAMLAVFIGVFIYQGNYEFIGYVVVVLLILATLLISNRHVRYPDAVLWGLFAWAFLHMLGGVEFAPGQVVYTWTIFPVVGAPYDIISYDQIIHAFGFFVATLVMYAVLARHLSPSFSWVGVGIVLAMAGLGLGALNEIVEFFMTVTLPQTNVGGYENTALDLVSNLIGAIGAVIFLRIGHIKAKK